MLHSKIFHCTIAFAILWIKCRDFFKIIGRKVQVLLPNATVLHGEHSKCMLHSLCLHMNNIIKKKTNITKNIYGSPPYSQSTFVIPEESVGYSHQLFFI